MYTVNTKPVVTDGLWKWHLNGQLDLSVEVKLLEGCIHGVTVDSRKWGGQSSEESWEVKDFNFLHGPLHEYSELSPLPADATSAHHSLQYHLSQLFSLFHPQGEARMPS